MQLEAPSGHLRVDLLPVRVRKGSALRVVAPPGLDRGT